jgi:hypothetical protein
MIRIRSIVALITHIVINITKPVREAKARIWAVVSLKEEEETFERTALGRTAHSK